jgi:GIY-YIG catalytic domain
MYPTLGDTITIIRDVNSFPFKLMNNSELQVQARKILDTIAFMPFEQCQPLTRGFENLPARPGIYAVRHRTDELLYIGKTKSLRGRFSGGHKAFLWAWLDKYNDEDVRIAVEIIAHWGNPTLLLELEAIILRATEPPYNVQIPAEM